MAQSFDQFFRHLTDSVKLSAEEIRRLHAGLASERGDALAGEQFIRELLREKVLDATQAAAILQGGSSKIELGDYLLVSRIAQSRRSMVFRAEHRRMQRVVALKLLAPHLFSEPGTEERVVAEVRRIARVIDPHVVATWGIDEVQGLHVLAGEFIDGIDLAHLVSMQGPLTVRSAVNFITQAARGLCAIHTQGLLHGDIQPAHLLLDGDSVIRLSSIRVFPREGVVRRSDNVLDDIDESHVEAARLASVACLAPEQALDDADADPRSDLYALGCTLFYLLAGKFPFHGESALSQILSHRQQPVPSLLSVRADVPPALDAICRRMLAKDPHERFASVDDLLRQLDPFETEWTDLPPELIAAGGMPGMLPPPTVCAALETTEARKLARDDGTIIEMPVVAPDTGHEIELVAEPSRLRRRDERPWVGLIVVALLGILAMGALYSAVTVARKRSRERAAATQLPSVESHKPGAAVHRSR